MRRTLLACLVLVMAIVPAASGVCDLGCDLDRRGAEPASTSSSKECPLHHQDGAPPAHAPASDRCGHDHTPGRVGLLRVTTDTPHRVIVWLMRTTLTISAPQRPARVSPAAFHRTPPIRPSRLLALRI